jgi:HEAT repeat protein
LVLNDVVMGDDEFLYDHCQGCGFALTVTMVVSVGVINDGLISDNAEKVITALNDVSQFGINAGSSFVASVVACCVHSHWKVRDNAIRTLARIVEKGDLQATTAVIACIQDPSFDVQQTSVRALGEITRKGDQHIIGVFIAVIADRMKHCRPIRSLAVKALGQLAEKHDQRIIAILTAHLEEEAWDIRQSVIEALGELTEKGDQGVIAAVTAHLQDEFAGVRDSAMELLDKITVKEDWQASPTATMQAPKRIDRALLCSMLSLLVIVLSWAAAKYA